MKLLASLISFSSQLLQNFLRNCWDHSDLYCCHNQSFVNFSKIALKKSGPELSSLSVVENVFKFAAVVGVGELPIPNLICKIVVSKFDLFSP